MRLTLSVNNRSCVFTLAHCLAAPENALRGNDPRVDLCSPTHAYEASHEAVRVDVCSSSAVLEFAHGLMCSLVQVRCVHPFGKLLPMVSALSVEESMHIHKYIVRLP